MVVREVPINFWGMVRDGALTPALSHREREKTSADLQNWLGWFPLPVGEA
jgi:hypothetical protein